LVLFAVGGGGDPERHLPLLNALAELGCIIVAPHFERLSSPTVTCEELESRARRARLALDAVADRGSVAGVGHSIGATTLLALAGGQIWMRDGERRIVGPERRLNKLALLAPATEFFRAPGALDAVNIPIRAWAGEKDIVTPPAQTEFLERTLGSRVPVQVRIVADAGHFSFMNRPPPHATETLSNREKFLDELAAELARFVMQ
jgi:pimeloyl-ACP methyl ester carboxylesterase